MPTDYKNSKIYKIYSLSNPDLVYVGSTTQPLSKRLAVHRRDYRAWKNGGKKYLSSFDIIDVCDDYRIELLEECPCDNREQLHKTEGKYIKELTCVNKLVAGRTKKEWRQDNKEAISQWRKQHCQDNQEAITQYHKQYYQNNKEAINQYHKQYYQDNKGKIKNRVGEKIRCDCGSLLSKGSLARHKRTQKHLKYLENK
jgi:hypothetical protein